MTPQDGWPRLFAHAFAQSRNAMALLDEQRRHVDVNGAHLALLGYRRAELIGRPVYDFVAGGPLATPAEWRAAMAAGEFTGEAELVRAGGGTVLVQWAAGAEVVTGRRLILFVVVSTSRWGGRSRPGAAREAREGELTARQREIVRHVALGSSGPEIAAELQISHDTVRTHVRNAMATVGARSRAHLVAKSLGEGLVLD
jgi:PAS domain S-box-containing protein